MPSAQTMYRALLNRDASFEGVFFVGVKTTGIFCRPTCPAKKPKFENVEYFNTPQDALYGGYRPCSRCAPLSPEKTPPELVRRLSEAIERAPTGRMSNAELRSLGIDPSTARRQFQRYYGMTFQAYQRGRRMGLALGEVRNNKPVIDVQVSNGFESGSGFNEAFKKIFGVPPSRARKADCMVARHIETPLGMMIALANDEGLHLLEFADRPALESEILSLRKRFDCAVVPGNNGYLDQIARELKEYFEGRRTEFEVPLVVGGTEFERKVWSLLLEIPHGETWSYAQMAEKLDNPKATRAVGRANGRNCLAIIIPCHRVVRSDGNLCGYGGGVWRKQWLLDHEQKKMKLFA